MLNLPVQYFNSSDYLELEKISAVKHEYVQGHVYAMAGSSSNHNMIISNLIVLLKNHLRTPCKVYHSDIKVNIEKLDVFYYPDLMVTCDLRDLNSIYVKKYPILIVEVLSPSTEVYDRNQKFANYQALESLQEYVLIGQNTKLVECYRLNNSQTWVLSRYESDQVVSFESLGLLIPVNAIYEDI